MTAQDRLAELIADACDRWDMDDDGDTLILDAREGNWTLAEFVAAALHDKVILKDDPAQSAVVGSSPRPHRSIGKVDDTRWGDCEVCGLAWPCPDAGTDTREEPRDDDLWDHYEKEKRENDEMRAELVRVTAERDEARAENERHRRANLVRAVTEGFDEWIVEAINAEDWDAVPWRVAERLRAELVRVTAQRDDFRDAVDAQIERLAAVRASSAQVVVKLNEARERVVRLRAALDELSVAAGKQNAASGLIPAMLLALGNARALLVELGESE